MTQTAVFSADSIYCSDDLEENLSPSIEVANIVKQLHVGKEKTCEYFAKPFSVKFKDTFKDRNELGEKIQFYIIENQNQYSKERVHWKYVLNESTSNKWIKFENSSKEPFLLGKGEVMTLSPIIAGYRDLKQKNAPARPLLLYSEAGENETRNKKIDPQYLMFSKSSHSQFDEESTHSIQNTNLVITYMIYRNCH